MRIKDKKKFVKTIFILIGLAVILNFILISKVASFGDVKYKTISVISGDTLWEIASDEKENNPYYNGKDVRDIISNIKKVNNLKDSYLKVDQELQIPTY